MTTKICVRCGEEKDVTDFHFTYKGDLSTRCRKCCKAVSAKMANRMSRMYNNSLVRGKNDKYNNDGHISRKRLNGDIKGEKCYSDYIDDAIERGDISKIDGAYYKSQHKIAKKTGVRISANRILL